MSTTKRRRRSAVGHLYRPKGRSVWRVRYVTPEGDRVSKSLNTTDYEEAKNRMHRVMAKGRNEPAKQSDMSLHDMLQLVVDDQIRNSRKDKDRIPSRMRLVEEFMGDMKAAQVDENAIDDYITARLKSTTRRGTPPKPATINRELALLKRALRLAFRKKKIARVPYVPKLDGEGVRSGFVERSELKGLLDALPPYLKNPIEYAAFTSWRLRGDVLSREWKHVSFESKTIRIDPMESKNDEPREIPMVGPMERILREQRVKADQIEAETGRPVKWVFFYEDKTRTQRPGKRIRDPRAAWRAACKSIGKTDLLIHDLRRSGVRNMMAAGMDRQMAMLISGHKTPSMFDRYRIVDSPTLRQQAEVYGSWYDEKPSQAARTTGLSDAERKELEELRALKSILQASLGSASASS